MKISMFARSLTQTLVIATAVVVTVGCGDAPAPTSDHGHAHDGDQAHSHQTPVAPPHGGTPVMIAADAFHLELVLNAAESELQAYVLDGHLERYVPVREQTFSLVVDRGEGEQTLTFHRQPPSTGGADAASSLFTARADWLASVRDFEARIPSIELNGRSFTNIHFAFPEGSMHSH